MATERAFRTCIVCGGRLTRGWFVAQHTRSKRWGYTMHFAGRGRIRRGRDLTVEELAVEVVRQWLGQEHPAQMAAAVFLAAAALKRAGWSLPWALADAAELERLRFYEAMVRTYGTPAATYQATMTSTVEVVDRTRERVDVSPRLKGGAVLELEAGPIIGGVTVTMERK